MRVNSVYSYNANILQAKHNKISVQTLPNQSSDRFCKSKNISFGNQGLETQEYEEFIEKILSKKITPLGKGTNGAFFKMDAQVGIKAPINSSGWDSIKEYNILRHLEKIDPSIAVPPKALIRRDNKFFLAMDIIKGEGIYPHGLDKQNIKNILDKLYTMDTHGILHCDLHSGNPSAWGNLIISDKGDVKIMDFGSFKFLNNHGRIENSEWFYFDCQKDGTSYVFKENTNAYFKHKFARTFFNPLATSDMKNMSDNPYLRTTSNVSNFEFRTLYEYLDRHGKEKNKISFFKTYLQEKSNYHSKMEKFLKSIKIEDSITDGDSAQSIEEAKILLKKAIRQEHVNAEVLLNPNKDVVEIELKKMQLKWLLNDFPSQETPISGFQKANDAMLKLKVNLINRKSNTKGVLKEYYEGLVEHFKNFHEVSAYFNDLELPAKEDLANKLFNKNRNKNIYITGATVVTLGVLGGIGYVSSKKKTEEPVKKPAEKPAPVPTATTSGIANPANNPFKNFKVA